MKVVVGISNSMSVEEHPVVQLRQWSIRKATDGLHFIGSRHDGNGRASTKIVQYDEDRKRGVTESGRIYELVGEEGPSGAALLTWAVFQSKNNISEV